MTIYHWILLALIEVATLLHVVLRPHREPASRLAWLVVVLILPALGIPAYLLLGDTRLIRRRRAHGLEIEAALPRPPVDPGGTVRVAAGPWQPSFALAASVNGLAPTCGNAASLAPDNRAAIAAMIADIEAARANVHVCFYIWLPDESGSLLALALARAARRGVRVRVLADALGSRQFVRSPLWEEMRASGVDAREALPVGNLAWTLIRGRVDLRNHRKTLIVDNAVAWCGSQNAADPEFRIKPRFAPWVDIMTRWHGPIARHWQFLFAADWMAEDGDDLTALLTAPLPEPQGDIVAQGIGTGPTVAYGAMPSCFAALIHAARRTLTITTPYFVPGEQVLSALMAAARRGVETTLVVPHRNDSRFVGAASRSHYPALLEAGVEIHEFVPGLLHAKTMVVDESAAIVGSANLDRRSFELNFENTILFEDAALARAISARQRDWLAQSIAITPAMAAQTPLTKRIWRNLLAMMSPLL
ncbi:phospholipase D-like domain-containing protein [Novosphingobium pituita]|uniref:Phospholipase D n=1 Tax=Novosphingobium pituita TaxID=3056842 RepID=A0ABQ6P716_9SPHN|nr:phospholipase D-like domain-containing protein [Novosphingobium sp. IK01]GMM60697.1 cardiolipin synthase [Novosphingobium sp. IK01]